MDSRGPPMYLHPGMSMMQESHHGSVPGSIPINVPRSNPAPEISGVHMSQGSNPNNFSLKSAQHNEMQPVVQQQQHYNQFPHRKEVYDDGRLYSAVVPETSTPVPMEGSNDGLGEYSEQAIKTEAEAEREELDNFMQAARDVFLQISSKELTIKQGADKVGRPYSFMYLRYQEFCERESGDYIPKTGGNQPKRDRNRKKGKRKGKKQRRPKRLTMTKTNSRLKDEVYQCRQCPATFNTEYLIKAHAKVHVEGNEAHLCTACGMVFPKLNKLMNHRVVTHQEALQCPHCDSMFTTVPDYKNHILTHTGGKEFHCTECSKGFRTQYGLDNHKRSHTGERPFMCGLCGKTFMTLNGVKSHRHTHTGGQDKPFECKECGKRYDCQSALDDHSNTHTGAKPYACDQCDCRYNFKQNLMRHKQMHEGSEGPHKCDECPAAFYLPTDLKSHKMAHTGIKPFQCELCDYSCTRKINMDFHKNTHTGETPFKCDYYGCNAEYSRPNSLKKHKLKHEPAETHTCEVCNEKFTELIALKRHMMTHTGEKAFTCDQCFKTFIDASSLKRHMWTHMSRPLTQKTKQVVKQTKPNPGVTKLESADIASQRSYEYQVPTAHDSGHSSQGLPSNSQGLSISSQGLSLSSQGLSISSQGMPINVSQGMTNSSQGLSITSQGLQTSAQGLSSTASTDHHAWNINSQYIPNLVNNAWSAPMDPDEFRRRLLHSFK